MTDSDRLEDSPGRGTVAGRFVEWGLGLRLEDVPEVVREAAKRHLVDALGCAMAAASTRVPAVEVARGLGGPPEATILGSHRSGLADSRTGAGDKDRGAESGAAGLGGAEMVGLGGQGGVAEGGADSGGSGVAAWAPKGGVGLGAGVPSGGVGPGEPSGGVGVGGGRVGGLGAALANGVLMHTLDFDDTHAAALVHASAPVWATALAVGEEVGACGEEVLLAAVVGLEVICRLGAAVPHGFHARGLHATSICGVIAAALVAARLYGLPYERAVDALGVSGSQAGGLLEFLHTGSSTKQLHPGFAAQGGILAARLARAGATGPDSVIEGRFGLYGALLGRAGVDPGGGLGERWETSRITIKPYPACQLLHAALDAAAQVVPAGIVTEVVVEVHADAAAIVCGEGKDRPRTPYDAKFSLPWSVAAMLVDGEVTVGTYADMGREDLAELAGKVRHEVVDLPGVAADQPGVVRVRFADGSEVVGRVGRSSGGPDDPDLDGLVRRKARANGLSDHAVELAMGIESLSSLRPLMAACGEAL
ncbi:MmgE/PrpD family protein [Nonomuraea sp. NPDC050556]|uniref:MmgE/PrpD family protein n=1 Tax=Nonomuraea sp. NPDC050556 TaxID=3364369 RepID=UPI00378B46B8